MPVIRARCSGCAWTCSTCPGRSRAHAAGCWSWPTRRSTIWNSTCPTTAAVSPWPSVPATALPFDSRQIRQNNYLFELSLEPGQTKRIYLRLESQGSIQAPLTLWSPNAYLEEQPGRIYVLGIIYGVLLVMLVYNLFIFLSVRDTSYLYYILYIASFGLYQISVNGAGIEYF